MIFGIVTEGNNPINASNKTELDAWVQSEAAPNTWVVEAGPLAADGVEGLFNQGRETYPLIDLSTMKIVSIDFSEATAVNHLKARLP